MSVKVMQCLFEKIFEGFIDTREGQKTIHNFCTSKGLNPTFEQPLSQLMTSSRGQGLIKRYDEFMNQVNWLIATVAAKEIEPEVAIYCLEKEFQKLKCYQVFPEGKELFLL